VTPVTVESARIEELRRRIDLDPASVSFATLAEEYRRAGRHDDAITTCLAGLAHHPGYVSARVTLGRALLEAGRPEDARIEFEQVVRAAPENLAAIRALATLHERQGDRAEPAAAAAGSAPVVAKASPIAAGTSPIAAGASPIAAGTSPVAAGTSPVAVAGSAPLAAAATSPVAPAAAPPGIAPAGPPPPAGSPDPALPDLEAFLSAIQKSRRETQNQRTGTGS
jgi:tetratricopeptide (TPR) repeat protein